MSLLFSVEYGLRVCPVCNTEIVGQSNKVFCSVRCRKRTYYLRNKQKILADSKRRFEEDKVGWRKRVQEYRKKVFKKSRAYHYQITCPKCGIRGQLKSNVEINTVTDNRLEYFYVTHIKSVREGKKVKKIFLRNCYLGSKQKLTEEYDIII